MSLDLAKPVSTRAGHRVFSAHRSRYVSQPPISGFIEILGRTRMCNWEQDGKFRSWDAQPKGKSRGDNSMYDLVNV